MKNGFSVSVLVIIGLLSGPMVGCGSDEVKPNPVHFVAADPPSGSTIHPDTTITITFDDAPVTWLSIQGGRPPPVEERWRYPVPSPSAR